MGGDRAKKSDSLILWLDTGEAKGDLPDEVTFWGDENEARFVYAVLQAVEWRWTTDEVLAQGAALLHDVLEIKGVNDTKQRIDREAKDKERDHASE